MLLYITHLSKLNISLDLLTYSLSLPVVETVGVLLLLSLPFGAQIHGKHLKSVIIIFALIFRWVHQVRSYGGRNLAVNIWWAHFIKFNLSDCEQSPYKDKDLIPLSHFDFHPQEAIRYTRSSC